MTQGHRLDGTASAKGGRAPRPVAAIDGTRCDRSSGCPVVRICPKKAVVPDGPAEARPTSFLGSLFGSVPAHGWRVDEYKCSGCLLCAQYCPHGAVHARERMAS